MSLVRKLGYRSFIVAGQMSNFRSLIHFTMAGSRWEKKLLVAVSSLAI